MYEIYQYTMGETNENSRKISCSFAASCTETGILKVPFVVWQVQVEKCWSLRPKILSSPGAGRLHSKKVTSLLLTPLQSSY